MFSAFRFAAERSSASHDILNMVGIDVIEKVETAISETYQGYASDQFC